MMLQKLLRLHLVVTRMARSTRKKPCDQRMLYLFPQQCLAVIHRLHATQSKVPQVSCGRPASTEERLVCQSLPSTGSLHDYECSSLL
jgi:hypothetical protein